MRIRRMINAIKSLIKAMLVFSLFVGFIGVISAGMADVMIDHRLSEMWVELETYYEAKYEADKAELEYRYGIRSMEEDWDDPNEKVNI